MRCYEKAMFRTAITGTLAMVSLAMGLVSNGIRTELSSIGTPEPRPRVAIFV